MSPARARRRHYGIAEIAEALGLNRQLVTVWRKRRSWGMPEPDDELASGPLWLGTTVEPWIDAVRTRLAGGQQATEEFGPALARRAGRRLLRLAALLLEDDPREHLVARAHAELAEAADAVRDCAPGGDRDRLLRAMDKAVAAKPTGDLSRAADACLAAVAEALPVLRAVGVD